MMKLNVSEVQDFMQCRFRWWARWVMNRVPVNESPALGGGKLLHAGFEQHFKSGLPLYDAMMAEADGWSDPHGVLPVELAIRQKAAQVVADIGEGWKLWEPKFDYKRLAVEVPFEWQDPEIEWLTWLGRPDVENLMDGRIWHMQNRGLAASMNFPMYVRLAKRHYHEHLYAEVLHAKYPAVPYGGTMWNLVRKLKYRTNVGKKNEATKAAEELFWQGIMPINLTSGLHRSVMGALRLHARDIASARVAWDLANEVPAPNEKMNGGYGGNSDDPYFRVLIGEVKLSDDEHFKPREDMYAVAESE